MNDLSESHGRRPLRGGRITSASSHPELLSGDLAVPPPSITSMNRSIAADGRRRTFGFAGVIAVAALLAMVALRSGATPDEREAQTIARSCLHWHRAAASAIAYRAQSVRDADLLQVGDSIFRMRRARRNCEAGWVALACQDYHAVAAGVPGLALTKQMFPCARVAASAGRQG